MAGDRTDTYNVKVGGRPGGELQTGGTNLYQKLKSEFSGKR